MERPCCLTFCDERLQADIEYIFKELNIDFYFIKQGEQLTQLVKNWSPFMILIDLTSPESEWIFRHIAQVEAATPGFPIVAFINETQDAVRQRAESYGCKFVFYENELQQKLPNVIEGILTRRF